MKAEAGLLRTVLVIFLLLSQKNVSVEIGWHETQRGSDS